MTFTTRLFVLTPLLLLASIVLPSSVSAHGGAVLSFTSTTTEGYIVDVDYQEAYIQAGSFAPFNFSLFKDVARTKAIAFTDLWVRISEDNGTGRGKTLFAGPIHRPSFGGIGFSYVFPKGGKYILSVRYNDEKKGEYGDTVAEAEFPIDVLRDPEENKFNFGMEFWIGLVAGLFILAVGILPFLLKRNEKTT